MPSNPLFGMPVVVGTSVAVMAIRKVFGCCCASAPATPMAIRAAVSAVPQRRFFQFMFCLPSMAARGRYPGWKPSKLWAEAKPCLFRFDVLAAD